MKRFLIPFFLVLATCLNAQNAYEGVYHQTISLPEDISMIEDEATRQALIDDFAKMKTPYTFAFSDGKSFFRPVNITKAVIGTRSIIYVDYAAGKMVTQEDVQGKMYLLNEKYVPGKWTILDDTDTIAGYACKKAVLGVDGEIVAWFTEEIPIPAGPMGYGSLPGLIVKLEMENMTYTLSSINPVKKVSVKAPSGGKKVTRDELDKIIVEKAQQMGERPGGHVKVVNF